MKIIDAHMHFSNVQAFRYGAQDARVDYSAAGLYKEYAEAGVVACCCMGLTETEAGKTPDPNAQNPMLADLDASPIPMRVNLGINPHRLDDEALANIKKTLDSRSDISGFKIYAGYYHVHINDPVYDGIYRLATERGLAVAIHSGDTYFKGGLVEYSHPINVDRLAHNNPDMKVVICHVGFPWIMDACEITYKHTNVHVDISGLAVGDALECKRFIDEPLIHNLFKQGFVFLNDYKKVIFGTDWPLTPIEPYIEMCKYLIPEKEWEDVFYNNAVRVYGL
ncbi:MAG: amidohydrolase [Defluviitaleaceae bacterium]|nr:amidohydrolase [Defluviitaleaceae bacterium]